MNAGRISVLLAISFGCLLAGAPMRAGPAGGAQVRPGEPLVTNIPYSAARPILESLRTDLLPLELTASADVEAAWPGWVARRDAAIRARVLAGDDESVLNLLLFGTTFTKQPRATEREIAQRPGTVSRHELIERRLEDLVAGASRPGDNARLQFARDILARHGIDAATTAGREAARRHWHEGLDRMAVDLAKIDRAMQAAQSAGRPAADLIERSTLFRERGLSTDTSIFSSFAIDRALDGLAATGTLGARSVRRVGIVGPGLDFVDKHDGFDFYPPQTIQPFAVIDSLLRFQLASLGDLRVTTLDLNPRINDHLTRAAERARAGTGYPLVLARDLGLAWVPRLAAYWAGLGDRIAVAAPAVGTPQAVPQVQTRSLTARPEVASAVHPRDLNIVVQHLPLADDERLDLIVATDILIYYDVFEQSLALANIAKMLRPGGVFLSNVTLFELPALPIDSIGFSDVKYLEMPEIGDRLVWYRRK